MTFAELIVSLVTLVFAVVFLAVYLLIVQAIFGAGDAENRMQTFVVVDIVLIVGLIVFWKGRQRIKDASARIAQALSSRPGAGPTTLPQKSRFDATQAYYKSRMAGTAVNKSLGLAGSGVDKTADVLNSTGAATGRVIGGVGRVAGKTVGKTASGVARGAQRMAQRGADGQPDESPPGSAGGEVDDPRGGNAAASHSQQLRGRLGERSRTPGGRLARVGTAVGVAAASGGTATAVSVVTRRAGRQALSGAAGSVRRAELSARLQPKALPAPGRSPTASAQISTVQGSTSATRSGSRLPARPASPASLTSPTSPAPPRPPTATGSAQRPRPPEAPQTSVQRALSGSGSGPAPGAGVSSSVTRGESAQSPRLAQQVAQQGSAGSVGPETASHDEAARRLRARLEAARRPGFGARSGGRPIALPPPRVPR